MRFQVQEYYRGAPSTNDEYQTAYDYTTVDLACDRADTIYNRMARGERNREDIYVEVREVGDGANEYPRYVRGNPDAAVPGAKGGW